MKMKLDLSQFKLKHNDGKMATLVHPHGHEFKIAVNALHPMNRKHLDSLEKHESPQLKTAPKSMKMNSGAASQSMPGLAKGGKVDYEAMDKVEAEPLKPLEVEKIPEQKVEYEAIPPKDVELKAQGGRVDTTGGTRGMYADGGETEQADQQPPVTVNVNDGKQMAPVPAGMQPDQSNNIQQPINAVPAQATIPAVNPEAQQLTNQIAQGVTKDTIGAQVDGPNDPYGIATTGQVLQSGIEQKKTATALAAMGNTDAARQMSNVADAAVRSTKEFNNQYKDNLDYFKSHAQALQDDIDKGHIDPNRYINNMSTGKKILTAIGLVLGGGDSGGFLQRQIANDIEAQKVELGKKENLLGSYMKQFGNLNDATSMMQANNNQIVSYKLKSLAAKQQGTQAAANALEEAGKLDMDTANQLGQIAMRKTLLGANQSQAGGANLPPENKIRALIPPGPEQDKHFKELAEAQKTIKTRDNLMDAFDKVAKMQTLGQRLANPVQSTSRINALVEPLTAGMSKETAGRYTEQDAHAIKALWPTLKDNADTVAQKRSELERINNEKINFPGLKSIGINPESFSQYKGPAEIKTMNGFKYQKIGNNWHKLPQ